MLALAGAVAVPVVVAFVVVGLRLTGDDDPHWAERATGVGERGLQRARNTLSAGDAIGPDDKRALDVSAGRGSAFAPVSGRSARQAASATTTLTPTASSGGASRTAA